ncbi:aminomethyltransferase [Parelusimicrobium proximum]|uniref:glycine cleavage system aminomethyltransferase GcvT n=1 Tax=Parelusimicrobium proximum TaxID=3228953 RepID=UPI003D17A310
MSNNLLRTPLFDAAVKAGGKMVDFHGWELAVQFAGIIAEHTAVRNKAGMFDVSHMGEVWVEGPDAHKFLQTITSNNVKDTEGLGTYTHIINERGGVIDDVIAFCLKKDKFMVVVNSATSDKDFAWFEKMSAGFNVTLKNVSADYGMVAVQGPNAIAVAAKLEPKVSDMPRFGIIETELFGKTSYITRTGYTGEDGVEIMTPADTIEKVWDFCLENGKEEGLVPAGLGVRDVLRLEAGYLLYGSDIDDDHNSYEAANGWVVKLTKEENFTAKDILAKVKADGVSRKLTKFQLTGAGVPRPGNAVLYKGEKIGELTSGTYSPVYKGIGMGYISPVLGEGEEVEIENGGRKMPAKVVKGFYTNKV